MPQRQVMAHLVDSCKPQCPSWLLYPNSARSIVQHHNSVPTVTSWAQVSKPLNAILAVVIVDLGHDVVVDVLVRIPTARRLLHLLLIPAYVSHLAIANTF